MAICLLEIGAAIKSMFRIIIKYLVQILSDFNRVDINIEDEQQNVFYKGAGLSYSD